VPATLGLPEGSSPNVRLFGWSGGFVAFWPNDQNRNLATTNVDETIDVSSSADGVRWTAGKAFDTSRFKYFVDIVKVDEGPSGLLAVGMPGRAVCGGPTSVTNLWTSADGAVWTPVDFAAQFGTATVWTMDAGSTGYVATGDLSDGTTQVVWTSADGRSWHRAPLPTATFATTVIVQGGTAFAGGYVLSGAVRGDEGCGGPRYVAPSLWWSSDAKGWTRSALTDAASGSDPWMSVTRITDRSLLAVETSWDVTAQETKTAAWVSSDGRKWNPVEPAAVPWSLYSNGLRCLTLPRPQTLTGDPVVGEVGDDLRVTTLAQSGDMPAGLGNIGWLAALGPSGLLVVSMDGANAWLGMPVAG
jgi:hypothetical protein